MSKKKEIVPHEDDTGHDRRPEQAPLIPPVRHPSSENPDETQVIKPPFEPGGMTPEAAQMDDPMPGTPGPKPGEYTPLKENQTVPGQ